MNYSNMSNQPSEIDLDAIYGRTKAQWMKAAERTVSIQERIALTVPWWLIIIAAGLFALSAGHTAGVFSHLSPVGYAGPFVVEFSLLWAAFARGIAKQGRGRISVALRTLELLAFVMAIAANGIGAMSYIADRTQVAGQSFEAILRSFGILPVSTQLEMLFVPMFALFIPIGTWVSGEGLANLFLDQRRMGNLLEQKWRDAEQEEMRRALYTELVRTLPLQDAKRRSEALSAALSGGHSRTLPQPSIKVLPEPSARTSALRNSRTAKPVIKDARLKVRDYLEAHPESVRMSVRELASVTGVGKTVAHEVLTEFKARH